MVASLPMDEYLALYNEVDLALDPFPHNGHTITCHTLWMGVPVLVLAGDRYAGRMGASIMTRIGLENFIASSPEHYVELACNLAANLDYLATLRADMRQRLLASPMCDRQQFGRDFLQALATMTENSLGRQRRGVPNTTPQAGEHPQS
jgi:predicted O-linked N-acetylglucosamine transferase (SPINDLY family)